ncbi:MAG: MCP four helix bundle domain-containing protein [SAR324 cluster bacterium]|nr:MCP four helix bundle domain-containing protein [SAR324 cluster bacterium]
MSETITIKKEGIGIFTKLLSGFFLVVLLNGIGGFYSYTQMEQLSDLTNSVFDHPLRVTRAVLSADINIVQMHRGMKDVSLSLTATEIETSIAAVKDYEKKVYEHLGIADKRSRRVWSWKLKI